MTVIATVLVTVPLVLVGVIFAAKKWPEHFKNFLEYVQKP